MSHITSHSRNPLLNLLIKLDAMGDAIIDLQGQFEWVIQKKISPQIFDNGLELNTVHEENGWEVSPRRWARESYFLWPNDEWDPGSEVDCTSTDYWRY